MVLACQALSPQSDLILSVFVSFSVSFQVPPLCLSLNYHLLHILYLCQSNFLYIPSFSPLSLPPAGHHTPTCLSELVEPPLPTTLGAFCPYKEREWLEHTILALTVGVTIGGSEEQMGAIG